MLYNFLESLICTITTRLLIVMCHCTSVFPTRDPTVSANRNNPCFHVAFRPLRGEQHLLNVHINECKFANMRNDIKGNYKENDSL